MNRIFHFIDILAWIFGTIFTAASVLGFYAQKNYERDGNLEKIYDQVVRHGVKYWPWKCYLTVAIFCWAWLISR